MQVGQPFETLKKAHTTILKQNSIRAPKSFDVKQSILLHRLVAIQHLKL